MIRCPHCKEPIESFWTLTAILPEQTRPIIDEAITELSKQGLDLGGSKRVAMGRVVEALAAEYLASMRGGS